MWKNSLNSFNIRSEIGRCPAKSGDLKALSMHIAIGVTPMALSMHYLANDGRPGTKPRRHHTLVGSEYALPCQ